MENREYYSEIKPVGRFNLNLRELAAYKELFFFFTWRDIKVKYKQTVLGFLWAVIQPLLMMLIFTFFVASPLSLSPDGLPYPLFAFSGLILWLVFSSGLTNAGNSLVSHSQIIKKIYFPRIIMPISAILVAVFDFLMTLPVLIAILVFYNQPIVLWKALVFWPLGIALTVMATLGPGCLLAALNVKYRDFRYVIPFLVQSLLFLTPAIYPVSMLKNSSLEYLVALNPMYAAITVFRMPMMSLEPNPQLMAISIASGGFFFLVGLIYFKKTEMFFADLA